ncbi:ArnT family glycosyltransferase [Xanthomarina spongicola]|uniref:4-amino-4-deoxy-L-arabinose transferase-like glycosyltransferase n=1 Tax=Xanthomarina spongicola TaxID=570520 RepID=A0A316DKP1_9FLAO|nr:glycosyltransferase family 39 protein [Xanthomarina spongicola]PWK18661.1 4-amino-4-deoxy-L-arabinose transferase-like glycosyltransferase [Xanthomarina spongicola]
MIKLFKKYPILSIIVFTLVMLLPNLNVIDVSIMEARNFITAREMVDDGNWLLTTMNGEPRYEKPPLPTWLTAISGMLFGLKSTFALRLPAILFIMVIGIYIFKISKIATEDISLSTRNAFIALTSFYIIGITIEAPWDIFTHGFMCIAIYHLFSVFKKEKNYWKHSLLAGCFLGLSFLCKGPISMYALMLPFLLAYGFTFKYKQVKAKAFSFVSILILTFAIGAWWYLYVRFQDPATFNAITQKETSNWSSYNIRPFYYYWSFFVQSGLWTIPAFISLLYPYLKSRVSYLKVYQFSILWTLFAVVLLSIIPEKKSRYLMPVLIPLAINIGFYVDYLIKHFKNMTDKKETIPVYFNFGLIAFIGIAFPILSYVFLKDTISNHLFSYILASVVLFSIGVFILLYLKKKDMSKVFSLTVLFFACVIITALPLTKGFTNEKYNPITGLKAEVKKQGINMYGENYISPEMLWYYGEKIPFISFHDGLDNLPDDDKFGLLTKETFNEKTLTKLEGIYYIKEITTYNINRFPEDSKQYNDRLLNVYYIFERK